MTFDQILTDLKNKIYYPVYLLFGEEPYYIDELSDYIEENVLSETEKESNHYLWQGNGCSNNNQLREKISYDG